MRIQAPFYGVGNVALLFYGCRYCRLCAVLLGTLKSLDTFRDCGICNILLGAKKMKDTAAACPGCSPAPADLFHTFFFCVNFCKLFSCARIVSTNSVLPGKSRFSPCAYIVSLNFFFVRLFASFQLSFFSVHFCAFLHFSPHACIVLRNSFFARIFSNFSPAHYRVTKLFFCAHFCVFYEL